MGKVYGAAGVPLTDRELEDRRRSRTKARNQHNRRIQEETARCRRDWEAGLVRPYLITMWLDARGLYGPEVDQSCGVQEPTVDLWEAGRVYPTWDQLNALAELCGVRPWAFTREAPIDVSRIFMCGRGVKRGPTPDPITAFDPLALAAAGLDPYPTARVTPPGQQGTLI